MPSKAKKTDITTGNIQAEKDSQVNIAGRDIIINQAKPAAEAAPTEAEQAAWMRSVAQVARNGRVYGVGFFISADGYFLTTQNAVDEGGPITLLTARGEFPARLVRQLYDDNLALLQAYGYDFPAISLAQAAPAPVGSRLYLVGREPALGLAVASAPVEGCALITGYSRAPLIKAPVRVSRSFGGAPAFDAQGRLAGMVVLIWAAGDQASELYILPTESLSAFKNSVLG